MRLQSAVGDALRQLGGEYENRELQKLVELSLGKDQSFKEFITGPRRIYVVTTSGMMSFSYMGEPSAPIKWVKDQLSLTWSDVQKISADPGSSERIRLEIRGNKPPRTISVPGTRRDEVITVLERARQEAAVQTPRRGGRHTLVDCPDCGHRFHDAQPHVRNVVRQFGPLVHFPRPRSRWTGAQQRRLTIRVRLPGRRERVRLPVQSATMTHAAGK